jgi:putative drug exporter of the RND superfamily
VPSGVLTPAEVLVRDGAGPAVAERLAGMPGVLSAAAPADQRAGGTAVVVVLPRAEAGSDAGQATIARVRQEVAGDPDVLGVAGSGAGQIDFRHAVYDRFPLMLAVVCVLTFLLLARAFRSLVLPAKAGRPRQRGGLGHHERRRDRHLDPAPGGWLPVPR